MRRKPGAGAPGESSDHAPDSYAAGATPLVARPTRLLPPLPRSAGVRPPSGGEACPVVVWKERDDQLRGARVGHESLLSQLARGDLPVHGTLDLHGCTVAEAERDLGRFFGAQRGTRPRVVIVVHGKGTHSPGGRSVLREALVLWLTSAPFANAVLAFATARARDGGTGALYVSLAPRQV